VPIVEMDRRWKRISIRLSASEFDLVQDKCTKLGSRSVSDFARRAIQLAVQEDSLSPPVEERVQDLYSRLDELSQAIERLGSTKK